MTPNIIQFCEIVRHRSKEHSETMELLSDRQHLVSQLFSVLRQEVDSMVRVIFILSQDPQDRDQYAAATLRGEQWTALTNNGRQRKITDREMVDLAQELFGWAQSVYRFGCSYIHLSNYHNHLSVNPFDSLSSEDKSNILSHMRQYHGGPEEDNPSMQVIISYIPKVFEKISQNLEYWINELEEGRTDSP